MNHVSVNPRDSRVLCASGDDKAVIISDRRNSSKLQRAMVLKGHLDYGFCSTWHPDGNLLATGNQVGNHRCGWGGRVGSTLRIDEDSRYCFPVSISNQFTRDMEKILVRNIYVTNHCIVVLPHFT